MGRYCFPFLLFVSSLSFIPHAISEPLYWVAKKESKQFLIFGSIHVGTKDMYPMPKAVTEYFLQSDGLILEADTRKTGASLPPHKEQTHSYLSSQQLSQLKHISNELRLDHSTLLKSPPWITAITIQMRQLAELGYDSGYGVDNHFMIQSTLKDKPLLTFESLQFQFDLLATLPNDGKELLTQALTEWDASENNIHCLLSSWQSGDKENLMEMANTASMSTEFSERMMTDRNHRWASKLDDDRFIPTSSKHLVVVGALHLVGEDNLLSLLEQKGYEVTQLSNSQLANCTFK